MMILPGYYPQTLWGKFIVEALDYLFIFGCVEISMSLFINDQEMILFLYRIGALTALPSLFIKNVILEKRITWLTFNQKISFTFEEGRKS